MDLAFHGFSMGAVASLVKVCSLPCLAQGAHQGQISFLAKAIVFLIRWSLILGPSEPLGCGL